MVDSLPVMDRYFCKQISRFWLDNRDVQRLNEVRWHLEKETSVASPYSNLRSFWSKCTVLIETSAYDIVVIFWPPTVIRRPGNCAPLPLVTSLVLCNKNRKIFRKSTNFQVRTSWTCIPWTSAIFKHIEPTAWIFHILPTKVTGGISGFFV